MTPRQQAMFEQHHEMDLAFSVGEGLRIRMNIYMQRGGLRDRLPPDSDKNSFAGRTRRSAESEGFYHAPQWACADYRADGIGQNDHAGGHD